MSALFRHFARLFAASGNPSGATAGDLWWRSDLSQMHASDGVSSPITIGPSGNLPVVRSAGWHVLPAQGSADTATVPVDRLFALPLWPGRSCTLTAAAVNVTLALVGGDIRMGLYASDGSVPTDLISDFGTVSVGVTGVRQISGLSAPLRPVLQYLVVARQGGLLNLGLSSRDGGDPMVSGAAPVLDSFSSAYYRDGVGGALPALFGAISGSVLGPSVSVQMT